MNPLLFILIFVFCFIFCLLNGSLAMICFGEILQAQWFLRVKPSLLKINRLLIPLWVLFALIVLFYRAIYAWPSEAIPTGTFRAFYLTLPFFALRGILYLGATSILAGRLKTKRPIWAPFCLILVLFLGSLASFDWILLLEPKFHSTIFGLVVLMGGCLMSYSYALMRISEETSAELLNDLNNVHLTMIAIWTYFAFMQYLTVWAGNLPEEVSYYQNRFHTLQGTGAALILIGQSLIPIPLLIFKKLKKSISFTRALSAWTLVLQALHLAWMIGANR